LSSPRLDHRHPVTGSVTQSPSISSHPSPIENEHTSDGSTTPQQAEEAKFIVEHTSSTGHSFHPSHAEEFTSPPPVVKTVHIAQATSIASSSVPEEPSPSAADIAAVATMCGLMTRHLRPQLQISEIGDISQVPAETPFAFAHPDSVPTPIPLSSGPPSSSVPDRGDGPDTLQPITLVAMLSPPQNHDNEQEDVTVSCASPDANEIPSTQNSLPSPPNIVISDSLPSRVLQPVRSRGMTNERHFSSLESAPTQPDHILDTPRSPFSSLTISSARIRLQVTSVSFAQVSTSIEALGPQDDTGDPNPPISMTALPHSIQTAIPAHDVVSNALPLEDRVQRDPDKS
jgi:hypothetical protein